MNRYANAQRRLRKIRKARLALGAGGAKGTPGKIALGKGDAGKVTAPPPTQRGPGELHPRPMGIFGRLRELAEELLHYAEEPESVPEPVIAIAEALDARTDFERFRDAWAAERAKLDPEDRQAEDARTFSECLHNAVERGERLDKALARLTHDFPWQREAFDASSESVSMGGLFLQAVSALQEDEGPTYPEALFEAEKRFPAAAMDYASGGRAFADEIARQKVEAAK